VGEPPKGAVQKAENAVGRGVVSKLYQGEPILEGRLAATGSGGGLAAIIPPGMRACAVKVNEVVGVAGFVLPGMRVDVLVAGSPTGSYNTASAKVKTLLQNIEVLSAGTNFQRDNEGKPVQVQVVNLLVTPEQAELLSLASNEMKIQLVLRNPLDRQMAQPPGVEMARLLGGSAPARPAVARKAPPSAVHTAPIPEPATEPKPAVTTAPKPPVHTVQVINGNKRSNETFPETGAQQ
jgi:pilus assembly protein CpaB